MIAAQLEALAVERYPLLETEKVHSEVSLARGALRSGFKEGYAALEAENARLRAEADRWDKRFWRMSEHYDKQSIRASAAEARVAVLEKALQPFAAYLDTAAWDLNNNGDPLPDDHGMGWVYLTIGNFREARAALTPTKENDHAE